MVEIVICGGKKQQYVSTQLLLTLNPEKSKILFGFLHSSSW
jgi:hypothetical protein